MAGSKKYTHLVPGGRHLSTMLYKNVCLPVDGTGYVVRMTYQEAIEALVQRRAHIGMSAAELSRRTGFSRQRLNNWEKSRANPSFDDLLVWADALSMTVTFDIREAADTLNAADATVAAEPPGGMSPEDFAAIQDFAAAIVNGDESLKTVLRSYAAGVAHQASLTTAASEAG